MFVVALGSARHAEYCLASSAHMLVSMQNIHECLRPWTLFWLILKNTNKGFACTIAVRSVLFYLLKTNLIKANKTLFCHLFPAALHNLLHCSCLFVSVNSMWLQHSDPQMFNTTRTSTQLGLQTSWGNIMELTSLRTFAGFNHWMWHVSIYPGLLWYRVFFTSICYCTVIIFRFTEPWMTRKIMTVFTVI